MQLCKGAVSSGLLLSHHGLVLFVSPWACPRHSSHLAPAARLQRKLILSQGHPRPRPTSTSPHVSPCLPTPEHSQGFPEIRQFFTGRAAPSHFSLFALDVFQCPGMPGGSLEAKPKPRNNQNQKTRHFWKILKKCFLNIWTQWHDILAPLCVKFCAWLCWQRLCVVRPSHGRATQSAGPEKAA